MNEPLYRICDIAGYIVGKDYTAEALGPALARSLRKKGWRAQLTVYRVPEGDTYRCSTTSRATSTKTARVQPAKTR